MKTRYSLRSINYDAIHSIVNRQVQETGVAPLMEKGMQSLSFEEMLSMTNCFPEPPARGKRTSRRTFGIDTSSVGSTMDHVGHKYSNGVQAAKSHQRVLLQNTRKQKLAELHSKEECIDKRVPEQESDREMIDTAFNPKLSSVDENFVPLESQRLEEDELTTPIFDSYVSRVVDKTIQDMTLESEIELLCVEESSLKDHPQESLHLPQSSQLELSNAYLSLSSCADGLKDTYKLHVLQKDFARNKLDIQTPDHDKAFLVKTDRKQELSQQKTTKSPNLLLSPVSKSNISPALKLLIKRRSESHVIAYDAYNPCNGSIQQEIVQSCSPLVSVSQEAIESRRDSKEVEDISKRGFGISNTCRSTTHIEIKCQEKSKRKNKVNSSTPNQQILEKNECAICIHSEGKTKKPLNCEDWQCLQGAGTSWENGVRRSSRIRSRPLEFWRGERFLYGRVLNCLSTIIGIKYISPESAMTINDNIKRFKVESYVDEKYSDAVNFAALY